MGGSGSEITFREPEVPGQGAPQGLGHCAGPKWRLGKISWKSVEG